MVAKAFVFLSNIQWSIYITGKLPSSKYQIKHGDVFRILFLKIKLLSSVFKNQHGNSQPEKVHQRISNFKSVWNLRRSVKQNAIFCNKKKTFCQKILNVLK